jgi:hypothetical protein
LWCFSLLVPGMRFVNSASEFRFCFMFIHDEQEIYLRYVGMLHTWLVDGLLNYVVVGLSVICRFAMKPGERIAVSSTTQGKKPGTNQQLSTPAFLDVFNDTGNQIFNIYPTTQLYTNLSSLFSHRKLGIEIISSVLFYYPTYYYYYYYHHHHHHHHHHHYFIVCLFVFSLCFCINMYFLQCFPVIYLDSVLYCSTM